MSSLSDLMRLPGGRVVALDRAAVGHLEAQARALGAAGFPDRLRLAAADCGWPPPTPAGRGPCRPAAGRP